MLLCKDILLLFKTFDFSIEGFFLLSNSALKSGNLFTTFLDVEICFLLKLEYLFLRGNYGLFLSALGTLDSFLKNILSLFSCGAKLFFSRKLADYNAYY